MFWNICPLQHLLARLEVDKPFVCRRIAKLLLNSYFPPDQADEVKLERCIHLVQTNRGASRRFYQYCGEMLDIPGAVKLMVAILTSVKIWVKAKIGGRQLEEDEEDKENNAKKRRKLYSSSMLSDGTDMSATASDNMLLLYNFLLFLALFSLSSSSSSSCLPPILAFTQIFTLVRIATINFTALGMSNISPQYW